MRVYTYYEPINAETPGTMQVWKESWSRHGWEPVVLGVEDFKQHPAWEFYDAATDKLPTFNNRIYERACYRRWMAMGPVGGGLMTDYDVVNRGLTPEKFAGHSLPELTLLCEGRVPCVVWGTAHQYLRAALEFARYIPSERDRYVEKQDQHHGKMLCEDMTILRHISDMEMLGTTEATWFKEFPMCCDISDAEGHPNTTLVHCSSNGCHGLNRLQIMKDLAK